MTAGTLYHQLYTTKQQQQKQLAILIDPDKVDATNIHQLVRYGVQAKIDYFFIGGSLLVDNRLEEWIIHIKQNCTIPVIIFPGSLYQISPKADALFFLSLISGRNPDLLIGNHVLAAPLLRQMDIEIMPTGYMLVDGGAPTTVSYISNSTPIPANKPAIAACTAMAGEMLGMKIIYMDAGSGAKQAISTAMIQAVRQHVDAPIVVGGGIRTPEQARKSCLAGADVIVVGNAVEKDPELMFALAEAVHGVGS